MVKIKSHCEKMNRIKEGSSAKRYGVLVEVALKEGIRRGDC
jgi:hypothetical protein